MDDVVGLGTLLAGRYRTLQPVPSDLPGASTWEATDQILDRPVRVTVLHTGQIPQALDAARRAALVTDARLVRVLDVGEHEGLAYTVTEQVTGPSLAELVARGPLPADQARAIVGEAAAALEGARRRGVHHLALRPAVLHLTPDDRVLLTGLAVDGALLGLDTLDAAAATRADTLGLVSLLYAALTGRWPGSLPGTDATGLPQLAAAPVMEGAPVAPAELTSGVPNDLDTLCAVTLGVHDDGPYTPAELVRELEPWGDIRATDLLTGTQVLPTTAPASPALSVPTSEPPTTPAQVQRTSVRSVLAGGASAGALRPGTPPPATPRRSSSITGAAARVRTPPAAPTTAPTTALPAAAGSGAAAAAGSGTGGDAPTTRVPVSAARSAGPDAPTTQDAPTPPDAPTTRVPPVTDAPTSRLAPTTRPAREPRPVPPAAAVPAAASASAAAPNRAPAPSPARAPRPNRPARDPATGPATGGSTSTSPRAGARPAGAPSARVPPADPADRSPLLGLGALPGSLDVASARDSIAAHRFDPTRLVLLLVSLAIVLGLFTAYRALTRPVDLTAGTPEPVATASAPAAEPAPAEPAPAEPPPAEAPPAAPTIASAAQLDPPPEGDQNEHPEAVPLAIDGDPATSWFTRTYRSPDFGGLKSGVGYAVTLAEPATVNAVALQVQGTGGRVELRATDPATPTEGPVLAEGALGPDTVLTLAEPTQAQHLVLWFTELPQTADGSHRIELAEVTLS